MQQHASRSELGFLHVHVSACMRRSGTGRCMHYVKIRRTGRSTNPSIAAATILEDQDLDVIVAPTQSIEGATNQSTEDIAVRSHVRLQSMQRPYSHIQAN